MEEYFTLSPVCNPCSIMLIELEVVLIPVELNPIGLIKILPDTVSLTTLTPVDVPIPTDKLGSTFKDILSPVDKLWETSVVTVDSMLSTFDVTESNTVSNWYLPRLSSPTCAVTLDTVSYTHLTLQTIYSV